MASKTKDNDFSSKISDEINCPICLDILVSPRTLVPCGHTFCRSCCYPEPSVSSTCGPCGSPATPKLSFSKCPHCRQAANETVPARQLESLIDMLVTVPNLLFQNDDDKEHYLKRRKKERERSRRLLLLQQQQRQKESSNRARKRRRQDNDAPSSSLSHSPVAQSLAVTLAAQFHPRSLPLPFHSGPSSFSPPRHYQQSQQQQQQQQQQQLSQQLPTIRPFPPQRVTVATAASFAPPTSAAAAANNPYHASSFDPMLAPLPPPYEFAANGPVLDGPFLLGGSRRPPAAPVVGRSRQQRRTDSTNGVSASDPICID